MNRRTAVVAVILAMVLAGSVYFLQKKQGVKFFSAPSSSNEKVKGPADAPVQIIEYSDFQCPACMKAQPDLTAILEEYPNKIRLTFRHYPLPMHQWAGLAHQAAECANLQGKFWQYHDKVYANQAIWSAAANAPEFLISYAKEVGVDLDSFGTCLSNGDVTKKILEERATGTALRLSSTPTFFINGERVVGQIELENQGRNVIRKILGLLPLPPQPPSSLSEVKALLDSRSQTPVSAQDSKTSNSSQN